MRRFLWLTVLLLLFMAPGCGGRDAYQHPDLSGQDEEQDFQQCLFEAQKATGNLEDSGDREDRIQEMVDSCMRSKGYTR